jgi:hypothetical protein
VQAEVEARPNDCFVCVFTPTATIRQAIRKGLPAEAEVIASATKENWKRKVTALRSATTRSPADGAPETSADSVAEGVVHRESVQAHEDVHKAQATLLAKMAWDPLRSKTNPTGQRKSRGAEADKVFCDQKAQVYQSQWRSNYASLQNSIAPKDPQTKKLRVEGPAYRQQQRVLNQTANKIEQKARRAGW